MLHIKNFIIKLINALLQFIVGFVSSLLDIVFSLFPPSPFSILNIDPDVADIIAKANYFLPIHEMLVVSELWLLAISIFLVYSKVARTIKLIN